MKIEQAARNEIQIDRRKPASSWLAAVCKSLRELPDHPHNRVLVAQEEGQLRAVLGLRLRWGVNGRLAKATIFLLEVDPDHDHKGIGSRLVRFAEGIARIYGCQRVDVTPDLGGWGNGRCWPGLGYEGSGTDLHKDLGSPILGACA